jgi:hypothetical protein
MMTTRNQKVLEMLKWCRENMCTPDGKRICLVCGHVPTGTEHAAVGVFIADEKHQKRIGAPRDKERLVIYLLCEDCYALPDRNERVEDKIFAVASVQ